MLCLMHLMKTTQSFTSKEAYVSLLMNAMFLLRETSCHKKSVGFHFLVASNICSYFDQKEMGISR